MARGRMINSTICSDKRINDLSDDASRLAFTWLVTFADCEGRVHGDPMIVRSMLFPRRTDITPERMKDYLIEWQGARLIVWYEADGDMWIAFPAFEKNQAGLRKDREAPSAIPAPPPQSDSGVSPELVRSNSRLKEKKGIEEKVARRKRREPTPVPLAVEVFRKGAGRYPPKPCYSEIVEAVTDSNDHLQLWETCCREWVSHGYNPQNVSGMLEWFRAGGPPQLGHKREVATTPAVYKNPDGTFFMPVGGHDARR